MQILRAIPRTLRAINDHPVYVVVCSLASIALVAYGVTHGEWTIALHSVVPLVGSHLS